ncbi:MAG: TlpA family protein disulfide reductase [Akkermansiaceae bacterium]|nr:TlpA family protein disulfide reductase [Verrucomicrobiales bacterium]
MGNSLAAIPANCSDGPRFETSTPKELMIRKLLTLCAAAALTFSTLSSFAAETNNAAGDLKELVSRIQTKLREGQKTEELLAPELKEFDALLSKYQGDKSDDVAGILFMKAMLYGQVFDNSAKSDELMAQLKSEFPDSKPVQRMKRQEEAQKLQAKLNEGAIFPDFSEKDLGGKPLSIANYKGKVVLIDFWATWCGPCIAELPNVLATYEKHHAAGFEVIGISLDQDRTKLTSFIEKRKMPWPQYFDGKGWENKLAGIYGIQSIPATFLLNGEGKIIAKDLRGEDLEAAVAKALKAAK